MVQIYQDDAKKRSRKMIKRWYQEEQKNHVIDCHMLKYLSTSYCPCHCEPLWVMALTYWHASTWYGRMASTIRTLLVKKLHVFDLNSFLANRESDQ
jgi:hypothetical protein